MKADIFCVALFIADNGESTAICKRECTFDELEKLKQDASKDYISLTGWLPIKKMQKMNESGGDVDEMNENFIYYDL